MIAFIQTFDFWYFKKLIYLTQKKNFNETRQENNKRKLKLSFAATYIYKFTDNSHQLFEVG